MYERYFQLRERPFALSPDPEYLYPSKVHQEALSYLRYGVEGHAGFVVITGEIGCGKTTMLQSLLGRLDRNTTVARIVNTMLDPRELLDAIMLDFGIDPTGMSKPVLLHRLAEFLVAQRHAGRLTLLVIDEAQNLSLPALEEIRMLSNLETEKSKLIQIIMIGQPELRETLSLPKLQQLRQRITVSYHLPPLDAEETSAYVNHRLRRAALGPALEFPREVTDVIYRRSRGVPRIINVIADATLLFAYGIDRRNVDVGITEDVLAELDATGVLASYQSEGAHAAAATRASEAETEHAMRIADEARRREQALAARERELAQREQQIAARQRVVEEEARILAAARAKVGAAQPAAAAPTTPSLAAATGGQVAPPPRSAIAPTSSTLAPAPRSEVAPTGGTLPGTPRGDSRLNDVGASPNAVRSGLNSVGASRTHAGVSPTHAGADPMIVGGNPNSGGAGPTAVAARSAQSVSAPTNGPVAPTRRSEIAPASSQFPPTRRSEGAPTTAGKPRSVFAATGSQGVPPTKAASISPSGVRVQRYQHTLSDQESPGLWERFRRVLFGITETETGA